MHLYPAIDLRGGRCVRLLRGDYEQETAYSDDPVAQARSFADGGAAWLHVVDLDGARSGAPEHLGVISAIRQAVDLRLQVGGGVRDDASAEALAEAGADRIVLGTAALEDRDLLERVGGRHAVAVGLDVRGREVAVRGWLDGTGVDVTDALRRVDGSAAEALVVTQIDQDGTLDGPDLSLLDEILTGTQLPVIASGGVGRLDHVTALRDLRAGDRDLAGAIVGRALYEGTIDLAEALAAAGS